MPLVGIQNTAESGKKLRNSVGLRQSLRREDVQGGRRKPYLVHRKEDRDGDGDLEILTQ